jgi:hypothetical protein
MALLIAVFDKGDINTLKEALSFSLYDIAD